MMRPTHQPTPCQRHRATPMLEAKTGRVPVDQYISRSEARAATVVIVAAAAIAALVVALLVVWPPETPTTPTTSQEEGQHQDE